MVRLVQIIFVLWMAYSTFTAFKLSHNSRTENPTIHRNNFYYFSNLISPIVIYIVEAYRLGNRNTILAFPSLYLLAMQIQGIAIISPVYAVLSALLSTPIPTRRFVNLEVTRALMPAVILGYILPTILVIADVSSMAELTTWVPRVYQFAPMLVCSLTVSFAYLDRIWSFRHDTQRDQGQSEVECYKAQDVPNLKSAYLFAFALQAIAHATLLVYAHNEPSIITVSQVVLQSFWNSNRKFMDQATELFSTDLAITFITWFISNIYSIWDLRRFGYITTQDGLICALSVVVGQLLVGPGATWAGLWYWREGVIVGLQRD